MDEHNYQQLPANLRRRGRRKKDLRTDID